jgi:hypothetical protein
MPTTTNEKAQSPAFWIEAAEGGPLGDVRRHMAVLAGSTGFP